MSKAYNRLEWVFLEAIMYRLGFCETWVKWIMDCVRTVSYAFMVNGVPRRRIIPSRGMQFHHTFSSSVMRLYQDLLFMPSRLIYSMGLRFVRGLLALVICSLQMIPLCSSRQNCEIASL
ncbi:hypothetical protein RchiOBHm_Chr4g0397521 [Rosa chinensis]|uniref:Uncharacterized protein n=1 Tax=Rosa chinensis TaxID=74649 RepID=A0A2P6QS33_ROSCH|nr:hypothetical protein RchiOBHm_Chr4g0397521 [Rosa chinensis]